MNRNLVETSPFFDLAKKFFNADNFNYPEIFEKRNSGLSNVLENENDFSIEISAPGLKKEDIKIELENELLKIYSDFIDQKEKNKEGYHKKEFFKSSFERSFILPKNVNKNEISATMTDGILSVIIPKLKEEKSDNIKITIK